MNRNLPIKTIDDFRNAVYAFRLPRIVATALDLDIFTRMGSRWWTSKALAKALKANHSLRRVSGHPSTVLSKIFNSEFAILFCHFEP